MPDALGDADLALGVDQLGPARAPWAVIEPIIASMWTSDLVVDAAAAIAACAFFMPGSIAGERAEAAHPLHLAELACAGR